MIQMKDPKAAIAARVQEHYDYLVAAGYEVIFTALQGSQNYGLDEYTDDYRSDVDTKSIVVPAFDDFVENKQPISAVEVMSNGEHAEVKDIRIMFEMFKKENISYIELLYSKYIIINPKYQEQIKKIIAARDEIVNADIPQFLKCIAGMAKEKQRALCHPYPTAAAKIEAYGFDGKQLSHCARLYEFILKFKEGFRMEDIYESSVKNLLMNYKKQLDEDGHILSKERAESLCAFYADEVEKIKEVLIKGRDYEINTHIWFLLDRVKFEILKMKFIKDLGY